MKKNGIKRRTFIQGSAGALCFLAGMTGCRAQGGGLSGEWRPPFSPLQRKFPLTRGTKQPDAVRMLAGYLEAYSPPGGDIGVKGGWTAVYDLVNFAALAPYDKPVGPLMYNGVYGQVAVKKPSVAPEYEIQMEYRPTEIPEAVKARIFCSDSPVAALKHWDAEWSCQGVAGKLSYTNRERGAVLPDCVDVTSSGNSERIELRRPLTCLWTLMDAVRRLPAEAGWRQEFDLYMDLSSLRRNQTLSFAGRGTVVAAGGPLEMRFYRQTGEGIEPIHYAVDGQQRTLFVTQGQLGWALNRIDRE